MKYLFVFSLCTAIALPFFFIGEDAQADPCNLELYVEPVTPELIGDVIYIPEMNYTIPYEEAPWMVLPNTKTYYQSEVEDPLTRNGTICWDTVDPIWECHWPLGGPDCTLTLFYTANPPPTSIKYTFDCVEGYEGGGGVYGHMSEDTPPRRMLTVHGWKGTPETE